MTKDISISSKKAIPTYLSVRENKLTPIARFIWKASEEVIKPILMMEKFINMCKSPIKCWCTNEILFICMSSNFFIEILHKKLVLESNKCSRVEVKNL